MCLTCSCAVNPTGVGGEPSKLSSNCRRGVMRTKLHATSRLCSVGELSKVATYKRGVLAYGGGAERIKRLIRPRHGKHGTYIVDKARTRTSRDVFSSQRHSRALNDHADSGIHSERTGTEDHNW